LNKPSIPELIKEHEESVQKYDERIAALRKQHRLDPNIDLQWRIGISLTEFAELTKDHEVYTGADLSKKIDLTADGYVIPLEDGRFAITGHGYIPEDSLQRHRETDRVPYDMWAKEKWCSITPGAVTDYSYINARMHEKETTMDWSVKEFCYDPYQATYYAQELEKEGYTCVEIRQGVQTLSEPTKLFREYIMQGKIVHDGSPLMLWCFANAVEEMDSNGNIKLSKKNKDDSQRIDVAAASMDQLKEYDKMIQSFKRSGILYLDKAKEVQELGNTSFIDPKVFEVENITIARVARVYNIPLDKFLPEKASYSKAEQSDLNYLRDTILPLVRMYEQNLTRWMLTPQERSQGMQIKLSLNGFARADMETRGKFYTQGIRSAWLNPDDIREYEDLPPLPGGIGQTYFVSKDLVPVEALVNNVVRGVTQNLDHKERKAIVKVGEVQTIYKAATTGPGEADMKKINEYSIRELTADEVFTFKVTLCDNEVDRDHEAFNTRTLRQLAAMYKGKTVIVDHNPAAFNQCARIYDTGLIIDQSKTTSYGEQYAYLESQVYMLRTPDMQEQISLIEAGILKEVSVGCAIRQSRCSICGQDRREGSCPHRLGESYDGILCFTILDGAVDAYEISFVAVPAQPAAGVTKSSLAPAIQEMIQREVRNALKGPKPPITDEEVLASIEKANKVLHDTERSMI